MCGILGVVGQVARSEFRSVLDRLAHRGPDGAGVWSDGLVTLGHRRLAILDLTDAGRQPMVSVDSRMAIVFNGELYNFVELRDDLRRLGHVFHSDSDTEVILNAYREWGTDCLTRFDGMWAFAIWDSVGKQLFLARDRFGKKPLYYAWVNNCFVFASEMKAVVPFLPDCRPSRYFTWMMSHIHEYEGSQEAIIEGIRCIPAGCHATVKDGTMRGARYWETLEHIPDIPTRYEEQVERFRELFVDACRLRLRADVRVGTSLSGGLDSTSVLAAVTRAAAAGGERVAQNWQNAFTVAFPGTGADESALASRVAERFGVSLKRIETCPEEALDRLEDAMYMQEGIYITSPVPMMAVYGEMRRSGVVVSLDGHGGDELLSGYNESPMTAYPDCDGLSEVSMLIDAMQGMCGGGRSKGWYLRDYAWRFRLRPAMWQLRATVPRRLARLIKPAHMPREGVEARSVPPDLLERRRHSAFDERLDHFGRHLYVLFHETTLPTLLRNYDRSSMAHGVEVRMPFLDHRLVTFCMGLPWRSKIREGYTKAILRDAMRPWLPGEVVNRRVKIGFGAPAVEWMEALRGPILDLVGSADFTACEVLPDAKGTGRRIEYAVKQRDFRSAERLWTDILTYFWYRGVIRRGQRTPRVVVR